MKQSKIKYNNKKGEEVKGIRKIESFERSSVNQWKALTKQISW